MLSTLDIAWLAGLLEGEGCFITGKPTQPHSLRIQLTMTDEDVVVRAAKLMDATLIRHRIKSGKTAYVARVTAGSRAAAWMMTLYSLMGVRRREKIRLLLSGWRAVRHHRGPQYRTTKREHAWKS